MKKLVVLLALVSLTSFAETEKARQDLPGVPAEVMKKMAARLGVTIDAPGSAPRAAAFAPSARPEFKTPVQHDTYCVVPQGGFGSSLTLMKVGSYDGAGKWKVSVEKNDGRDTTNEEVTDAVVKVKKDIRFDRVIQSQWGLVQTRTETKTFIAQLHVSSPTTVLGHVIAGCIPQETKEVDLQVSCYDSVTLPWKN